MAEEMTARILLPERFSEPLSKGERDEILSRSSLGREFMSVASR